MKRRRPRLTKNMREKLLALALWAEAEIDVTELVTDVNSARYDNYVIQPRSNPDYKDHYDMLDACEWIWRLAVSGQEIQGDDA